MLSEQTIRQYNQVRKYTDKSILCHAPFVNINFEQNGNMTACCYNRKHALGTYPNTTIEQAWTGEKAEELREYIKANNLGGGCYACEELIGGGSYLSSRAILFDHLSPRLGVVKTMANLLSGQNSSKKPLPFPKSLEFEISNTCNLECEMCNGYFSSSIRKNRENKPPLANPYDENFVEQLVPFIPHLKEVRFLGGEPFLIDIYYKIWNRIAEINPGVRVHITTNGTVMNQKVRDLVNKLNCTITVSLDSLNSATYERIRSGARFERVMENVAVFMDILKSKQLPFSISICPMTLNWKELPDIVRFANKNNVHTYYNTVWHPLSLSLRSIGPKELRKIIEYLKEQEFDQGNDLHKLNVSRYKDVIQTISHWLEEIVAGLRIPLLDTDYKDVMKLLPEERPTREIILLVIKNQMELFDAKVTPALARIIQSELTFSNTDSWLSLKNSLSLMSRDYSSREYIIAHNSALVILQKIGFKNKINSKKFEDKMHSMTRIILNSGSHDQIRDKALASHPLTQILFLDQHPVQEMVPLIG